MSKPEDANDKYIVHENKVYEYRTDGLFRGYIPVTPAIPQGTPVIIYTGPKMPISPLWREVLAFFKWGYDTSKSEVQVRLYLNEKASTWKAWAFPQEEGTGMSAKEIPEACDLECKKVGLFSKNGWIEAGTVHSHCACSAFQSGTDRDNEKSKNGIHVTVGKIDEKAYDISGRVSYRGTFFNMEWTTWFEMPTGLEGLPWSFRGEVMKYFLTNPVAPGETFPDEWKENVIKNKAPSVGYSPSSGDERYSYVCWQNGVKKYWDRLSGKYVEDPPTHGGNDVPKIPGVSKLSKKEQKLLQRLIRKADLELIEGHSDMLSIQRAGLKLAQFCEANQIETGEIFKWHACPQAELEDFEKEAVKELEGICDNEGVRVEEVDDLLESIQLAGDAGDVLAGVQ